MKVELAPRTVLNRYTVVSKLGSGGMANVYLVRHNVLQTVHAMKVLKLPSPGVVRRLMQEGRLQGQLRHPNVVAITDVVEIDGAPGLVMEYVEGPSLKAFLKNHPATLDEVDVIARGILSGVAAAHRASLIHRDLKPANILLQLADGQLTPKITDFGLAKAIEGNREQSVLQTKQGARLGTPAYMAPEQILDSSSIDEKADIFALGNILYELLAGKRPFRDRDVETLYGKIQRGDFEPIDSVCEGLPQPMLDAVTGALRVDRHQRIGSVAELLELWQRDRPAPTSVSTESWSDRLSSEAPIFDNSIGGTDGTSADTWHSESVSLLPASSPPRREARSGPRWALAFGAIGVLLAVAAAGWIATRPAPHPEFLTADSVPLISDDPVAQDHFERAWDDFRDAAHAETDRRMIVVVERAPDVPIVRLFNAINLMMTGSTAAGIEEMRVCRQLAQDTTGPVAEIIHAIVRMQERGNLSGPELPAYIEKYPDDYLALVIATQWCWAHGLEACEARVEQLKAVDPTRPIVYSAAASGFRPLEAWPQVRSAVEQGLALNPNDPDLLQQLGSAALGEGDVDAAKKALRDVLSLDHSRRSPKIKLAQLGLLQNRPEMFREYADDLLSDSVPANVKGPTHSAFHTTLMGLGRFAEADEQLAAAQAIEEQHGSALGVLNILSSREHIATQRGDYERAVEFADQIGLLGARDPGIPDSIRSRMASYRMQLDGTIALAQDDVKKAKEALSKMETSEDVPPQSHSALRRSIAIAESDVDTIKALHGGVMGSRCTPLVVTGSALHVAGADFEARPMLEEVLATSGCSIWFGPLRGMVAAAHVSMAEIELAADNPEAAAEHLRLYRELWPDPDPDLPLVKRATAMGVPAR